MINTTPTPRQRFNAMPDDVKTIVTEEAVKGGLSQEDLFPDYVRIQAANVARKAAVIRLLDAGHAPKVIAEWFGVSKVAVMQTRKGWPSRMARKPVTNEVK